jgi:hypothetical protein
MVSSTTFRAPVTLNFGKARAGLRPGAPQRTAISTSSAFDFPYDDLAQLTLQWSVEGFRHFDHIAFIKRIGVRVYGKRKFVRSLIGVRVRQCRGSQQGQSHNIALGGVTVLGVIEDGNTVTVLAHCSGKGDEM